MVRATAIALCLLLAGSPVTAAPVMPAGVTDGGDVVLVAKKGKHRTKTTKWHKTRRGEGQLLGRVADIDRRENRRKNRQARRGNGNGNGVGNAALGAVMLGIAGAALGASRSSGASGGYGGGPMGGNPSGCGIDVTTPNPVPCAGGM